MEQEQLEKILQAFEIFRKSDIASSIIILVGLVIFVVLVIIQNLQLKKKKQLLKEYESTLNEEQRKQLRMYKELEKWVY